MHNTFHWLHSPSESGTELDRDKCCCYDSLTIISRHRRALVFTCHFPPHLATHSFLFGSSNALASSNDVPTNANTLIAQYWDMKVERLARGTHSLPSLVPLRTFWRKQIPTPIPPHPQPTTYKPSCELSYPSWQETEITRLLKKHFLQLYHLIKRSMTVSFTNLYHSLWGKVS